MYNIEKTLCPKKFIMLKFLVPQMPLLGFRYCMNGNNGRVQMRNLKIKKIFLFTREFIY